jgi:hypothetical protein
MMPPRKKPEEVKLVRSTDHRSHYIIGAVPQWTDDDLRLHLYNEVVEGENEPFFMTTAQLIIPKTALPRILDALKAAVRNEGKTILPEASVFSDLTTGLEGSTQDKKTQKRKVQKIRRK